MENATGELGCRERIVGRGGVFARLPDVDFFGQIEVAPAAGTIIWPTALDCCLDVLCGLVTGAAIRS